MKRVKIEELLSDRLLLQAFCDDLKQGAVVVLPTDTLYGFAVAADCTSAVENVYRIKNRSSKKPLILFVHEIDELQKLGFCVNAATLSQLQKLWPGALTAVLPAPDSQALSAFTFASMGVRIPDHQLLLELLNRLPCKLLTTSANRSGDPSDTNPEVIASEFADEVAWLVDGGVLAECLPSTVADFTVLPPLILRQGKIKL